MATVHLPTIGDEDVALLRGSGHRRRERAAGVRLRVCVPAAHLDTAS